MKEIAQINPHEIRKPLANILGIPDILETTPDEDFKSLLKMLKQSGIELDEIVRNIAKKALI